ncbi:MAG: SDR family oxidoreductase [bacterium]|nr:SDR family oxidoreductase [bacterium]
MRSLKDLMSLKGRVAMITGGAGHVGSAIAEALAELGAHIVLLDNNASQVKKQAKKIVKRYRVKTMVLSLDLMDEVALKSVPQQVAGRFGRLDILVHCAALVGTTALKGWAVPFAGQKVEAWNEALAVNLTSVFILTQSCTKLLEQSGNGSIITLNSIYGMVGPDMGLYAETNLGNPAAYAASKGGLLQLTRWFATVLAPKVRVNTITSGGIFRNHTEPFLSRYITRTPLRRMGKEEDIKGAATYLASDLSNYVTGQNIVVDGGWTAW